MRVAVLGASGGTGRQLVAQALQRGHQVDALVRDPDQAALPADTRLTVYRANVHDAASVAAAIAPESVVISGLGRIQAEGGEVVDLRPGDSIWAPAGERHWHGAMPGQDFTYASIQPIDPATGSHVDWQSASER